METISEQYRLIRSNILFSSVDKEIKSIMVTSPEPSDGKSTTAVNLAIVLAQQGKRVLLIDADLRKPTIHYIFHVSGLVGLTGILARKDSLKEGIIKTGIPNLYILPSGEIPPNPSEILNSRAMEALLKVVMGAYDHIVIDTPPLLSVTDPQIMANRSDGVVLVIASGKTHKDRALKAKELLLKAKAKILGVVLNGVVSKHEEYYHR